MHKACGVQTWTEISEQAPYRICIHADGSTQCLTEVAVESLNSWNQLINAFRNSLICINLVSLLLEWDPYSKNPMGILRDKSHRNPVGRIFLLFLQVVLVHETVDVDPACLSGNPRSRM